MLTSDFNYLLPPERIAQTPLEPRDHSRLMIIDKKNKTTEDRHFYDMVDYLKAGDVVVWNNSKVFKARLSGKILLDELSDGIKKTTGDGSFSTDNIFHEREVEIFLVRPMQNRGVWKVLAKPARKLRLGMKLFFAKDFEAEVLFKEADGTVLVQFADDEDEVREKANRYGSIPLPPYIEGDESGRVDNPELENRYQTVYAKHVGSVAAPTAGFHFTNELVEKLRSKGVEFAEVTLHVGLGTFLPVKSEVVEEHTMHSELVEISQVDAEVINRAKAEGRRIIAVGTTSMRALEGIAREIQSPQLCAFKGDIDIFITPGFEFKIVDALITNFHLPKSTLLMLVSAFAEDREFMLHCYEEAIKKEYRFYSFGDAMFIH
jgi:S-adenosylmethionine:tRNA ribosyltransferase-isomerase